MLMDKAGYSGYGDHVLLHRELAERTLRIAPEPLEADSAYEVLSFLREWWMNHINSEDREYAPSIQRYTELS
jgi:hemerythrin